MDKEFLHTINLEILQKETGLDIQGIADLIDVDVQSVKRWTKSKEKNGNRPLYNNIIRLIKAGATFETLFGVRDNSHAADAYINARKQENLDPKKLFIEMCKDFIRLNEDNSSSTEQK